MLALALLVVHDQPERGTRSWRDAVVEDSASYVDGEAWKSPDDWRTTKQWISSIFKGWLRPTCRLPIEVRRGIVFALTRYDGPGRVHVNPTVRSLDDYLAALYHKQPTKSLLGVGGDSWATGAVKRSTYLMPRVARLVREKHAALVTALEDGINAAKDASAVEGAPSGRTTKSPSKQKRKIEIADLSTTVEHLGVALATSTHSRQQAVRRAAATRDNAAAAVERRAENARVDATLAASGAIAAAEAARDAAVAAANKQRDAAIARARVAEDESQRARAAVKRLRAKQSDPAALRRFEQALARERKEGHFLRVSLDKVERALNEARKDLRERDDDEPLFRRSRGKGAGRGLPHGQRLRRLIQELLVENVFPSRVNRVIVKVRHARAHISVGFSSILIGFMDTRARLTETISFATRAQARARARACARARHIK